MVTMVHLDWLAQAQAISERIATPHRLFDVEKVKADATHPTVMAKLVCKETANTGIKAGLDRFLCVVEGRSGSIHFMVDLIEGLVGLSQAAAADGEGDVRIPLGQSELLARATACLAQLVDAPDDFEFEDQGIWERCDGWVRHALEQLDGEVEQFRSQQPGAETPDDAHHTGLPLKAATTPSM